MTWFHKRVPFLVVLVASCTLLLNLLQPMSVFAQQKQGLVSTQSGDDQPWQSTIMDIIKKLQPVVSNATAEANRLKTMAGYEIDSSGNCIATSAFSHVVPPECVAYQEVHDVATHRQGEIDQLNSILKLTQPTRDDLDMIIEAFEQDAKQDHDAANNLAVAGAVACTLIGGRTIAGAAACAGGITAEVNDLNNQAAPDEKRASGLQQIQNDLPSSDS